MKKTFLYLMTLALTLVFTHSSKGQSLNSSSVARSSLPTLARNIKIYTFNGKKTPVNHYTLGKASFLTPQEWTVDTQVWSDVVVATGCKKDEYDGGTAGSYKVSCRQNSGYGDLFSWEAVNTYKDSLCSDGWRVPTKDDFAALDTTLRGSGTGTANYSSEATRDEYLSRWGGSYGGYCESDGVLYYQGRRARYWAQSQSDADNGFALNFTSGSSITPQYAVSKQHGYTLRCVR